jgi:hypothetical protein
MAVKVAFQRHILMGGLPHPPFLSPFIGGDRRGDKMKTASLFHFANSLADFSAALIPFRRSLLNIHLETLLTGPKLNLSFQRHHKIGFGEENPSGS